MTGSTGEQAVQTAENIAAARSRLSSLDPALAVAHSATPAFFWRSKTPGFASLVRLVIEQQVSVASAAAIWKKFEAALGTVDAAAVLSCDIDALRALGLSGQKAGYVRAIALAHVDGRLDFALLRDMDDTEAVSNLMALKGVGRWTAEAYLMGCENRTDFFPAGDLALQEGLRMAEAAMVRLSEKQLYVRAELWRPFRGVAAHLLWAYYTGVKRGEIHLPALLITPL